MVYLFLGFDLPVDNRRTTNKTTPVLRKEGWSDSTHDVQYATYFIAHFIAHFYPT